MAFALNTVSLGGYLTAKPELRYSRSGKAWATFTIAVNDGPKGSEAQFVACKCFEKTAELLGEHYGKGSPILVQGRLRQERWTTEGDESRSRLTLVVDRLVFLPTERKANDEEPEVSEKPTKAKGKK